MQAAVEQFQRNASRVHELGHLYQVLSSQTTQALDLSDLLRAELVMIVSSLDQYVHELVRLGMLECFGGQRPQTDAFLRFQVSLNSSLQAIATPGNHLWLEGEINTRHSYRSFQKPDDIADAVRLMSSVQLWDSVASHMQSTTETIKGRLTIIVDRRNQIVHEADSDPSYGHTGRLWPIDAIQTNEAVRFIEELVEVVHTVVA